MCGVESARNPFIPMGISVISSVPAKLLPLCYFQSKIEFLRWIERLCDGVLANLTSCYSLTLHYIYKLLLNDFRHVVTWVGNKFVLNVNKTRNMIICTTRKRRKIKTVEPDI